MLSYRSVSFSDLSNMQAASRAKSQNTKRTCTSSIRYLCLPLWSSSTSSILAQSCLVKQATSQAARSESRGRSKRRLKTWEEITLFCPWPKATAHMPAEIHLRIDSIPIQGAMYRARATTRTQDLAMVRPVPIWARELEQTGGSVMMQLRIRRQRSGVYIWCSKQRHVLRLVTKSVITTVAVDLYSFKAHLGCSVLQRLVMVRV
jgi:hypothetical protein